MAIQKTKTLPSGLSGNYWRILNINFDRTTLKAQGKIGLFKDAAASAAGKPHIPGTEKTFVFPFVVSDLAMPSNIIALVYTKIMDIANQDVTVDLEGNPLESPRKADPDIAGGEVV